YNVVINLAPGKISNIIHNTTNRIKENLKREGRGEVIVRGEGCKPSSPYQKKIGREGDYRDISIRSTFVHLHYYTKIY
ncbi:MAG: hypothetical protein ACLFSM_06965, partial [Thermoplasmata archaeon]